MGSVFKFGLGDLVMLAMSGEKGEVRGRAEYTDWDSSYYVRYVSGHGCQVEDWISESALELQTRYVADETAGGNDPNDPPQPPTSDEPDGAPASE